MPRLGLALGGGGARGFAQIPVLELLDELGLRPSVLAGTSIGALIGALYASGIPGREIRGLVEKYLVSHEQGRRARLRKGTEFLKWIGPLVPDLKHGGIKPDRFLRQLFGDINASRFADLEIPLAVITADFWTGEEVILREGPLLPAVRASTGHSRARADSGRLDPRFRQSGSGVRARAPGGRGTAEEAGHDGAGALVGAPERRPGRRGRRSSPHVQQPSTAF